MKRIITVLLSVCMIVCMMPSVALAEGTAGDTLPDGLIRLDYIESTGEQVIDTGVPLMQDISVEAEVAYVGESTAGQTMGWSDSGDASSLAWGHNSGKYLVVADGCSPAFYEDASFDNNKHVFYIKYGLQKIDNITFGDLPLRDAVEIKASASTNSNLFLFARHVGWSNGSTIIRDENRKKQAVSQFCKAKLYSCKIWENGQLIREFIPFINLSSGKSGLYDVVNSKEYYNLTTEGFLTDNKAGYCGNVTENEGKNVIWTVNQNNEDSDAPNYTLTISGNGNMTDIADVNDQPWCQYKDSINKIIVDGEVTHIGKYAFNEVAKNGVIYLESESQINLLSNGSDTKNYDKENTVVVVAEGGVFSQENELSFDAGQLAEPTKEGYIFAGWYEKDSAGKFKGFNVTTPAIGKTYYARWVQASDDGIVTNEEELLAAIASANGETESKVQIKGEISLTNQIVISNKKISFVGIDKDASIVWKGEEYSAGNAEKPMFTVEDNSSLSFEDLVFDGKNDCGLIWCSGGSTVSLGLGSIFKNGARSLGAGFNVGLGSEISIDGAIIDNCIATGSIGGAFYMGGGTVIMNSGSIINCSTNNHGPAFAWCWNDGRLVMNGGTITGCSTTNSSAISGEVSDDEKITAVAVIELYGGCIYKNTSDKDQTCDGVRASSKSVVKIGGDIKICGSSEEKAGIFSNKPIQVAKPLKEDALIEVYETVVGNTVAVGTAEHKLTPADAEHFFNKAPGKCFDYVDEGDGSIVVAEGYQVKYNYNDNTGNYTWDYADKNGNTTLKAGPERSGYEFVEWNTADNGTGTSYAADYAMNNLTADVVLYAQWELKNPTVTVKADKTSVVSGSSVMLTAEVSHGAEGVTYEYQWYAGGTDENNEINGATEKDYITSALTSDTTYYCKVKAKDGSKESGTVVSNLVKVTVAAAEGNVTITNDKTIATHGEKPFTFTYTASGDVTVASSNTSVATVEKGENNSVKVTVVGEGETVISVEFAGNKDFAAASDSFTLTVKKATPISYPTAPADPAKAAKAEAVDAVNSYVKPAEYEKAEQAEIKKIVDEAKKDIEAAKTAEEVKAIEAATKAEIDKLETAEEKALIKEIKGIKLVARSKQVKMKSGKKAVEITWKTTDGKKVKFDGVEIYRSVKRYSGYGKKPFFSTKTNRYYNTLIKTGRKYYYRVRGFKYVNDEKVYTEYSKKAWRTVK